jgi:hypothetical protein
VTLSIAPKVSFVLEEGAADSKITDHVALDSDEECHGVGFCQ